MAEHADQPNVARIYDYLLGGKDHFAADQEAGMIVGIFRQRMAPGSYLIISQGHSGPASREDIQAAYSSGITLTGRSAAEIGAYFDGFDLMPPGLVPVAEWAAAQPDARPDAQPPPGQPAPPASPQAGMLAGVGRKRP